MKKKKTVLIIIPALGLGMFLAWCFPQKALLVLLAILIIIMGIALIVK